MADWFVRSGAAGAATGADWANAFVTLTAANTASSAGDRFWIADDHAETSASAITLLSKGTAATPSFFYCVDRTVASPGTGDLKTTGTITSTGASNVSIQGSGYYYGLTFSAGTSGSANLQVSNANAETNVLDTCKLVLASTGAANVIYMSSQNAAVACYAEWRNVTVKFAATTQAIQATDGRLVWKNTDSAIDATGSLPATLFTQAGGGRLGAIVDLRGVDLSALGSGKTIVGAMQSPVAVTLADCKLGASVTVAATPGQPGGTTVDAIRCDSAATSYRQERYRYQGTLTQETTIVRTGGASDGTTSLSHKIVATANAKWAFPFEAFPIAIWNSITGRTVTASVEIVASAALNNDDVWLEVEYLGSASTPQETLATSTKANNLATGTAVTVSSGIWASSPGFPQRLTVSMVPRMAGYIRATVKVGKASQTVYVDPLITLS